MVVFLQHGPDEEDWLVGVVWFEGFFKGAGCITTNTQHWLEMRLFFQFCFLGRWNITHHNNKERVLIITPSLSPSRINELEEYHPTWRSISNEMRYWGQWRNQGLPGWASRPPGGLKWGRKWRTFEEKWEKLQENEVRLRKCSYLAHPGMRGWLRLWLGPSETVSPNDQNYFTNLLYVEVVCWDNNFCYISLYKTYFQEAHNCICDKTCALGKRDNWPHNHVCKNVFFT